MSNSNEDTPTHNEAYELLPWWVNGTLSPSQHNRIAGHIRSCNSCQQEVQLLNTLNDGLKSEGESIFTEATDVNSDLAKVMLRIDGQNITEAESSPIMSKLYQLWQHVTEFLHPRSGRPWLVPALTACVLFVCIGSWNWYGQRSDNYSVLSSSDKSASFTQFSIQFTSNTEKAEALQVIRKQSNQIDQEVIVESLGSGQYLVRFVDSIGLDELSEILAELQANKNVENAELR